jgi:hypothetical protein
MRAAIQALGASVLVLSGGSAIAALLGYPHAARSTPSFVAQAIAMAVPSPPTPVATDDEPPEPFGPYVPFGPPRKVHLPNSRVTPAITRTALEVLGRPMGSEVVRTLEDNQSYAFVVEPHYHSPDSGKTPVGWHKGVTVYTLEQ